MEAKRTTSGYQLHDDLARLCLPGADHDPSRKLAWTNSICILFLLIGLVGAKQAADFAEPPPQLEEAVAVIIEPMKPPPSPEVQKIQVTDQNQSTAPQMVAVTLDTPAINFAVPTIGNLVVPAALAQAPSPSQLVTSARVLKISSTGQGGALRCDAEVTEILVRDGAARGVPSAAAVPAHSIGRGGTGLGGHRANGG